MLWRRPREVVHAAPGQPEVLATSDIVATTPDPAELQDAYDRGRRDERRGRKRHPLFMALLFLAAAVGVFVIVMAASRGSFEGGGAAVDQNLEGAADRATPVVRGAVADAGQAVQNAGQDMKSKAADPAN